MTIYPKVLLVCKISLLSYVCPGCDVVLPRDTLSTESVIDTLMLPDRLYVCNVEEPYSHIQGGPAKVKPTYIFCWLHVVTFECIGKIQWFLANVITV